MCQLTLQFFVGSKTAVSVEQTTQTVMSVVQTTDSECGTDNSNDSECGTDNSNIRRFYYSCSQRLSGDKQNPNRPDQDGTSFLPVADIHG